MTDASSHVARLWLDTLNRIGGLASHELRGAINSVSVSLEVVRSRALRPTAVLPDIAPFAESASGQLEAVTGLADALLYLVRRPPEREDVGATARRLGLLLDASARSVGGGLSVERGDDDGDTRTSADAEVSRLTLAAVLLAATGTGAAATCRLAVREQIVVRVACEGSAVPRIDDDIAAAAASAGIDLRYDASEAILAFPSDGAADRSI